MDEQYLVDVDKQPIRNAIFRTLAGLICAASLFAFWSDGVRAYEAGWAHFDMSSGLWTLVSVPAGACTRFCVNGLMAGSCQYSQRKRNDRKQRIDRPPAGGLQKA